MFEKSLVDLIRGMRKYAGNERDYMQKCLKECRSEIQSQDMDIKATALLKVIYLEMFGNDMSWASFRVLEVMASAKYHQKRVGYLGAVQSFRPETEVLMLATNLLKKDLTSPSASTIILPMAALPHISTSSLALSCLSDLLPRLSHAHPSIRKKAIVTLYRLALVYPETLRAAWPKIKERLMDQGEDPSVTAAIVNVICELGWRRPHDFLPLAPRLFELLVDAHNNWMAIKLIKLFATLTHAEPRLVKKLLPPLTDLIRTTTAMSLLYECINGIIQGGILGSPDDISGREEIASLCVSKLRGMIMVKNDPNLKYVALLAFNKIVTTHPFLVAEQEDVILECIDSRDITIRVKALDLVQGIVSSSNLMSIVTRLMRQLKSSGSTQTQETDDCDEDPDLLEEEQQARRSSEVPGNPPLPEDYRVDVMSRILSMCSQDNYGHLVDFDWYIDILTQLVRSAPPPKPRDFVESSNQILGLKSKPVDIAANIGNELRNVAVRVRAYRISAVRAAETIMARLNADIPLTHPLASGALEPILWILGEFADNLSSPEYVLNLLLHLLPRAASPEVLSVGLQSTAKMLAKVAGDDLTDWTLGRKSRISLLLARVISVFEPLSRHPSLEVQERAVEFVELLKLTAEAVSNQPASTNQTSQDTPLLLTQAIPSLFSGWELNSVAPEAQRNVPVPEGLDLDEPIHPNLGALLATADHISLEADETDEFDAHYHRHPEPPGMTSEPAINRLVEPSDEAPSLSYQQQQPTEDSYLDADIVAKRKAERIERNRDDPFYIGAGDAGTGSTLTPIHNILQTSNGPDLDIDAIPVMQLDLDRLSWSNPSSRPATGLSEHPHKKSRPMNVPKRVVVTADETLGGSMASTPRSEAYGSDGQPAARSSTKGKSIAGVGRGGLLSVDSSNLRSLLSLEGEGSGHPGAFEKQQREEAEMAAAVKEVERLRLQMQRASERIQVAEGVEVVSVKSKKAKTKKNKNYNLGMTAAAMAAVGSARKKEKAAMKKKGVVEGEEGRNDGDGTVTMATKVKKKKKSAAIEEAVDAESSLTGGAGAEEKVVVVTKTTKTKKKKAARIAAIED